MVRKQVENTKDRKVELEKWLVETLFTLPMEKIIGQRFIVGCLTTRKAIKKFKDNFFSPVSHVPAKGYSTISCETVPIEVDEEKYAFLTSLFQLLYSRRKGEKH
jgi:hypothetical protein